MPGDEPFLLVLSRAFRSENLNAPPALENEEINFGGGGSPSRSPNGIPKKGSFMVFSLCELRTSFSTVKRWLETGSKISFPALNGFWRKAFAALEWRCLFLAFFSALRTFLNLSLTSERSKANPSRSSLQLAISIDLKSEFFSATSLIHSFARLLLLKSDRPFDSTTPNSLAPMV